MTRLLAASCAVAVLLLAPAFPRAAVRTLPASGAAALDAFLKGQVDKGVVPGVVAVVVNRTGTLYSGAFGKQNTAKSETLQTDSIFRIASMTKAVTSVATMMMIEQGKLKLDDDVATYLPAFKSMQVLTTYDEKAGTYQTKPNTTPSTIRHLLTHTSGIGYSESAGRRGGEGVGRERIDVFTERHISKPLGMQDTFYEVPKAEYARVVTTTQKDAAGKISETQNPDTIPVSLRGDGGLFSTAPDYGKFLQMLLNGGQLGGARLLKASTVAEMLKPHTNGVRVRPQPSDVAGCGAAGVYELEVAGSGLRAADTVTAAATPIWRDELGLKLERRRVLAEVVVVDRLERPTPD